MTATDASDLARQTEADRLPGVPPPRPRRPPTLAHRLEFAALRSVIGLLSRLGLRRAGAVGAWLGRLGYRPLGIRREVVERQIAAAFPEFGPERVRSVARGSLSLIHI